MRKVVTLLLLAGSTADVHLVAETLGTSARTLQRRLQAGGLTFAGVVRRARYAAARQFLRDPGRKVGEVARALGYSDPAHFTRAFRSWAGSTPREFRRAGIRRAEPSPPVHPRRRSR